MHEVGFKTLETFHEIDADCVRIIGSIALSSEASLLEYILASISVLNRRLGRTSDIYDLQDIIFDVVRGGYWENNKKNGEPIINSNLGYSEVQTKLNEIELDLTGDQLGHRFSSENNLVSSAVNFELTDLGKKTLAAVVIP